VRKIQIMNIGVEQVSWLCNFFGHTAVLTVFSGTVVFVSGQIFIEFCLKPIRKYKELKADTAFCLRFYRSKFTNCIKDEDAEKAAKELSAKFIAYSQEKPFWLFAVSKKNLLACCQEIATLHHSVSGAKSGVKDASFAIESEQSVVKILNLYGFRGERTK